jgi:hypothetical protein
MILTVIYAQSNPTNMHDLKRKGTIEVDRSATPAILAAELENVRHWADPP